MSLSDLFGRHASLARWEAFARSSRPHLSNVRQSLRYLETPESITTEILPDLRLMLIDMHHPSSERRHYSGRGELLAWLRVSALQKAGPFQRRAKDVTVG